MRSSVGKQRGNRQARGKDGVSRRFLAALAAGGAAAFLLAGPVATMGAAWSGGPRTVQGHRQGGGGDEGDQGDGSHDHGQGDGGAHPRHHGGVGNANPQSVGSLGEIPPVTTATLPPVTLPAAPIPANLLPTPAPAAPAPGSPASRARAVRTSTAPAASAASGALAVGGLPSAAPPGPPPDVFPTPGAPKGPGGALQTARSYSLLLALAAAVVAFLALQGRLGRRDPRISTPQRDDLDFEDFE